MQSNMSNKVSHKLCKWSTSKVVNLRDVQLEERSTKKVWLYLCCIMTPGLSMDIQCHVWPYFF